MEAFFKPVLVRGPVANLRDADILGVAAAALLVDAWLVLHNPGTPFAVLFGIPLMGHLLGMAAFPRASTPGALERLTLGTLGALALVPLLGLIADRTPARLALGMFGLAHAGTVILVASFASFRRSRTAPRDRLSPSWWLGPIRRDAKGLSTSAASLALVAAGAVILAATAIIVIPGLHDKSEFSELLVLPKTGTLSDIPRQMSAGSTLHLTALVGNQHRDTGTYQIDINAERGPPGSDRAKFESSGDEKQTLLVIVPPGGSTASDINVSLPSAGTWRVSVTSTDTRDGSVLQAHLWVEVSA